MHPTFVALFANLDSIIQSGCVDCVIFSAHKARIIFKHATAPEEIAKIINSILHTSTALSMKMEINEVAVEDSWKKSALTSAEIGVTVVEVIVSFYDGSLN